MLRVSFSSSVDEPRLEHCRKSILSKVLWDEMLGSGRLDWAWIGDEEVSYENALSNPASIVAIDTEMMAEGRFVFSFRMVDHPTKFKVVIEKFEIRKRVVGRVFGYRAEISMPTIETAEKSYFDTNTSSHHHFFDVRENELIDIHSSQIELKNIPNPPKGKSIKDVDVVINVENDSQ